MGTSTDPYQRCEGKYHLTRGVARTLAEARNPFSILTRSTLILPDLDLLADAARHTDVGVNLSIGTLDEEVWKLTKPVSISSVALHLRRRVKEHWMGWLAGARPELVDSYRVRYRRAYPPASERGALAVLVKSSVDRGRVGQPYGSAPRARSEPVAPAITPSRQLRMEL
jgi:hypothetical protein